MDRVRASTQLSSYAVAADHSAGQKPGSALGHHSIDATAYGSSKTKPGSPTRRKPKTVRDMNARKMLKVNRRTSMILEDSTLFTQDPSRDIAELPDQVGDQD